MQYLFPEFTKGEVIFIGEPIANGNLNYNMLFGEMHFLDNNQQVMALSDIKNVLMVNIDNRKFYPFFQNEFTEELLSTDYCSLRMRHKASVAEHGKKGAYGMTSATSSSKSLTSMNNVGLQFNLNPEATLLVSMNYFFYLVGTNGKHKLIKNTKTFTKQFPKNKTQIETFVKENRIRFNNSDDLKALFSYCIHL